ncbi:hypothetical protein BJX65DRAFT_305887 [Aspergillus insuetus]
MGDGDQHRIIVGVDFGTTFTGASFVSTRAHDINDIVLIKSWPGPARHTEIVLKTPSRIAYAAENGGRERWGYQVEPGMVAHSWTKLLLDLGTPLTQFDDALEDAAGMGIFKLPPGKSAIQVVADYLSNVYRHILQAIAKQITEATLQITPLEFWFTIPAIWSDEAKHATLQAARLAGFGTRPGNAEDKINLITEPEAAAIAALRKAATDGMGASVRSGDGVLVCDCGGGTVDITTYLIQTVHPKLEFEELCTGIGGKCGSTAVDRNFYMLMKARFGKAFDSLPRRRTGPGSEFMNKFEIVKRDFGLSTEDGAVHHLPLNMPLQKADPEYFDVDERYVLFDDLQGLFEPVVSKILNLVRQQVEYANEQVNVRSYSLIVWCPCFVVEHKDVRKVVDITVDFRNVNLSVFKTKQVSGRLVYKLDYSLNVIFGAQEGVLKFEARANGQVIGKTSVDFARALFY